MALVEVIDPLKKKHGWPGEQRRDGLARLESPPSSVGSWSNARWIGASPGLECASIHNLFAPRETQYAMVFERGDLVGVLCACDLIGASPADPLYLWMSRRVITIDARASTWLAARIMAQTGVGCLPVIEGGRILGMIDREKLLEAGIPLDASGAICSACGTHRHVPIRSRPRLCVDCYQRAAPAHLDDDGGVETGSGG